MGTTPDDADNGQTHSHGSAETRPPLPDLDRPPSAPLEQPRLADRFARVGPASDWFPAVVLLVAVLVTVLATAGGFVGQVTAAVLAATAWMACVRIHVTPSTRLWAQTTEAAVIGILLLLS